MPPNDVRLIVRYIAFGLCRYGSPVRTADIASPGSGRAPCAPSGPCVMRSVVVSNPRL
jgi:hypothetical protein